MQIRAESGKSALPICNYSQILYQFLTFTQNLKRSRWGCFLGKHYFFLSIFIFFIWDKIAVFMLSFKYTGFRFRLK